MGYRTLAAMVVTVAMSLGLLGCGEEPQTVPTPPAPPVQTPPEPVTGADVRREAGEAMETTAKYVEQQREKLTAEAKESLDALRKEMDELAAKAEAGGEAAKESWSQMQAKLEPKMKAAEDQLAKLGTATGAALEEAKTGITAALDDIKQGLADAKAWFQNAAPATAPETPAEPNVAPTDPNAASIEPIK